jgi:large subunit ribosomal protein L32e
MLMIVKKKKPAFHRQLSHIKKRARPVWRRPRGKDSKQKRKEKERGARPCAGYSQPAEIRYLHPRGFLDVLVSTPAQVAGLDPLKHAVRVASGTGARKRAEILRLAEERKLHVLNPGKPVEIKTGKKKEAQKK